MSDANRQDDARGVHEGEAEGHVQSPSHHLADPGRPPDESAGGSPLQDPEGNPAVGAAEDKSGRHPSARTNPPAKDTPGRP